MKRALAGATCAVLAVTGTPEASAAVTAPSCHTSRRAFPFPLAVRGLDESHVKTSDRFVALTATRNGLWAGYAFNASSGANFGVITWRAGQKRATVLKRWRVDGVYYPTHPGSVNVAGITPRGEVVVSVQRFTQLRDRMLTKSSGYAFYRGRTYRLPRRSNWFSVQPSGVADNGTIYGLVASGSPRYPHYYAASWPGPAARPKVLIDFGRVGPRLVISGRGDIAYARTDGEVGVVVRLASGRIGRLYAPGADFIQEPMGAAGPYVYANSTTGTGVWDLSRALNNGDVPRIRTILPAPGAYTPGFLPATVRGDAVLYRGGRDYLRTAAGALVRLPRTVRPYANRRAGSALKANGKTVAVTLKRDGLVHFVRCR